MARILVVDDSATLRKVVASILTRHGHEADVAADGMEGIERLRSRSQSQAPYQLVLLDFVMPKMNGYQFCRVLREDEALCAQPVVLMSAKSDKIRETFVRQTGALDAISKPFDAQALVVVVDNALRRVERGHQSQSRITLEPEEPVSLAPPSLEDTQARVAAALGKSLDGRSRRHLRPPPLRPLRRHRRRGSRRPRRSPRRPTCAAWRARSDRCSPRRCCRSSPARSRASR